MEELIKSGYVALVGRPNVGKSTLLNRLVGDHLAIVSNKPQTTRNRIIGVRTTDESQLVFVDTPGIHKARDPLNRFMVKQALGSIPDADVLVVVIPADEKIGKGDQFVVQQAIDADIPFVAVLNKIDRLKPDTLRQRWDFFAGLTEKATEQIAISALKNSGVDALTRQLEAMLPEGPAFFPPDMLTDQPEVFYVAELIREQIYCQTHAELPYSTAVRIDEFSTREDGLLTIRGTIAVEHDSQKGILIGKGGARLKSLGSSARASIEKALEAHVFLDLKVEVRHNWSRHDEGLGRFGYTESEDALV